MHMHMQKHQDISRVRLSTGYSLNYQSYQLWLHLEKLGTISGSPALEVDTISQGQQGGAGYTGKKTK